MDNTLVDNANAANIIANQQPQAQIQAPAEQQAVRTFEIPSAY